MNLIFYVALEACRVVNVSTTTTPSVGCCRCYVTKSLRSKTFLPKYFLFFIFSCSLDLSSAAQANINRKYFQREKWFVRVEAFLYLATREY